ncbi:hypothetical protein [Lactococcus petauri]|uniref:hypothetical protein n=1 Tax=Lactococcus petauri TaxID=1940789 RepID=UPI001F5642B1|nr:hypothetical protein [Lactococcus petauri]
MKNLVIKTDAISDETVKIKSFDQEREKYPGIKLRKIFIFLFFLSLTLSALAIIFNSNIQHRVWTYFYSTYIDNILIVDYLGSTILFSVIAIVMFSLPPMFRSHSIKKYFLPIKENTPSSKLSKEKKSSVPLLVFESVILLSLALAAFILAILFS